MELPICRHRSKEPLPNGNWVCTSTKIIVSSKGVPSNLCKNCYLCDHEPVEGEAPSNVFGVLKQLSDAGISVTITYDEPKKISRCVYLKKRVRDSEGKIKKRLCKTG